MEYFHNIAKCTTENCKNASPDICKNNLISINIIWVTDLQNYSCMTQNLSTSPLKVFQILAIIYVLFHEGGPYHVETNFLFCKPMHCFLYAFYIIRTSVMKELKMKELKEHINWKNNDAVNEVYIWHHSEVFIITHQLHSADNFLSFFIDGGNCWPLP